MLHLNASSWRVALFGLALLLSNVSAADIDFFTGANIYNKDKQSYSISYKFEARTRVCFVRKPTAEIKRSLSTTLSRDAKGLRIISRDFDGENAAITASIDAGSKVYCLCTDDCEITVGTLGTRVVGQGKTLIIKKGKLTVR